MRRSVADANTKEAEMKTTIAWKMAMFWLVSTEHRIRRAKFKIYDLEKRWGIVVAGYARAAHLMGNRADAAVLMEMLEQQEMTDDWLEQSKKEKLELSEVEQAEVKAIMVSISTVEALKNRLYRLLGWDEEISEKSVGIPGW